MQSKNTFIPLAIPDLRGDISGPILKVIKENWLSTAGKEINELESQIANISNSKYALATITGSSALHLALKTLGIGKKHKVLIPDLTFAATINAVILSGATPIIVDVNDHNWTIDLKLTEQAMNLHKPDALIVVHTLGNPAEISQLKDLCKKYEVLFIEDAAGAIGATYKNKPVGSFGNAGIYSFNGNKIITTGAGGALLLNSNKLYLKAKLLYSQARVGKEYNYEDVGYNYRMPNINAVLGLSQINYLSDFIKDKRKIASIYDEAFFKRKDIIPMPRLKEGKSSCWLYSIRTASKKDSLSLINYLYENNIESRLFWNALSAQRPYKSYDKYLNGISYKLTGTIVSIPCSTSLNINNQERVIDLIMKWKGREIIFN